MRLGIYTAYLLISLAFVCSCYWSSFHLCWLSGFYISSTSTHRAVVCQAVGNPWLPSALLPDRKSMSRLETTMARKVTKFFQSQHNLCPGVKKYWWNETLCSHPKRYLLRLVLRVWRTCLCRLAMDRSAWWLVGPVRILPVASWPASISRFSRLQEQPGYL